MIKQRHIWQMMMVGVLSIGTVALTPASANSLASLFGQKSQPKFLPVHEAFQVTGSQAGDVLTIRFTVTPKHYVYQDRLTLRLPEGVTASPWQFNKTATVVEDPTFGRVPVFEEDVVATAKLSGSAAIHDTVSVRWQGCAKAGLCYPPEDIQVAIQLNDSDAAAITSGPKNSSASTQDTVQHSTQSAPAKNSAAKVDTQTSQAKPAAGDAISAAHSKPSTDSAAAELETSTAVIPQADAKHSAQADSVSATAVDNTTHSSSTFMLDHSLPAADGQQQGAFGMIALLFLAGLLLAFTPCVYPMLPIVANIIARQDARVSQATHGQGAKAAARQGFMLSASYGLGVATAYGLLGAVIAWFGQALGISAWFQRPAILLGVAALFVLFALMMADIVRVQIPTFISRTLNDKSRLADEKLGSTSGSYLAGLLSALVVSPCVSAPLAGALTLVAATNSVAFGFIALFMLGLGLSLPLIVIGTAQARWLPKSGAWMQAVRELGALLLLGVAILLANRVWLGSAMLIIWAAWFILVALWLWRLGGQHTVRYLALLPVAWAAMLGVGAWAGSQDAWRPLAAMGERTSHQMRFTDIHATRLDELDQVLIRQPKVLVDVTADWCIECRIMERTLFTERSAVLANDWQVVKLDISDTTDDSRAILNRYQLFGPPALLVYKKGKLEQILLGETKPDALQSALADD